MSDEQRKEDEVEGHWSRPGETDEPIEVEGHWSRPGETDEPSDDPDDDIEAHVMRMD